MTVGERDRVGEACEQITRAIRAVDVLIARSPRSPHRRAELVQIARTLEAKRAHLMEVYS